MKKRVKCSVLGRSKVRRRTDGTLFGSFGQVTMLRPGTGALPLA